MKKYKHIIFDIDGTLLDTEYAVLHSLQDTLMPYLHKTVPTEELTFVLGIPGEVALEKLGIRHIEEANRVWNDNMRKYRQNIRLFDGVCDMLESLQRQGYELGIITSKTRQEFETDFAPHGANHYFKSVICVDDSPKPKPNPDPILAYLKRNGLSAKEAVYIGDTEYDSRCAHSAGADFGLALWGCNAPDGIACEYRFESPITITAESWKKSI